MMNVPLLVLSVVYAAAVGWLLWVAGNSKGLYALAKGVCSTLFVFCGVLAFLLGSRGSMPQFILMLAALVLCAFGDVFLGVANKTSDKVSKKPFLAGAASFTLAHAVFCILFAVRSPFKWYDLLLPLALMGILRWLEAAQKIRLKKIRPLAYLYTFMVGMMAGKAAESVIATGLYTVAGAAITAGALRFLASDVILLFLYFGTRRHRAYRAANLVTYYLGVYMLALSTYWF